MDSRRTAKELSDEEIDKIKALYDANVRRAEQIAPKPKADANRHVAMHGTRIAKAERWAEYQAFIDGLHMKNLSLSYNKLTEFAGIHFSVHKKTIWRHTENPRKRRTSV